MDARTYLVAGYWTRREWSLFAASEQNLRDLLAELRTLPAHPWLDEAIEQVESDLTFAINGPVE